MFKRLTTWLYKRFNTEPINPTEHHKAIFDFAKRAADEFARAGYDNKPKPPYPKYKDKELSSQAKEILDERYYDACALYGSSMRWVIK